MTGVTGDGHVYIMADKASPDRHISTTEMECLKEAFALFDRDRDGEISTEELGKVSDEKQVKCYLFIRIQTSIPMPESSLGSVKYLTLLRTLSDIRYDKIYDARKTVFHQDDKNLR